MFSETEQISAFAAYAMKRKNTNPSLQSQKLRKINSNVKEKNSVRDVDKQGEMSQSLNRETIEKNRKRYASSKTHGTVIKKNINTNESNSLVIKKYKEFKCNKNKKKKNLLSANDFFNNETATTSSENTFSVSSNVNSQTNRLRNERSKINKKETKGKKKIRRTKNQNTNYDVIHDTFLKDPVIKSKLLFEWLIHPLKITKFFE